MLLEAKPENGHEACGSLNESLSETTLAEVNGNFQFFLPDALGTVRDIVDDAGDVIQSYEFNEHGIPMPGSGAGSGTFSPKTYQGGLSVNDDRNDSGLYLMGHRHYASDLGRFISRDPIGFSGGLNLFGTAFGNNPVTYVDPSGKEVDVRFIDGTWGVAHTPQELETLITGAADGSIVTINARGHGRPLGCGFDPDAKDADGLWVQILPNRDPRVLLATGKPKEPNFAELVRPKLSKNATIWLSACNTATGNNHIAKILSGQLPGVYVQGIDGSLNDLFGIDLYVSKGPIQGASGTVKVYQDGNLVPATDIIREPYGIHPRSGRP